MWHTRLSPAPFHFQVLPRPPHLISPDSLRLSETHLALRRRSVLRAVKGTNNHRTSGFPSANAPLWPCHGTIPEGWRGVMPHGATGNPEDPLTRILLSGSRAPSQGSQGHPALQVLKLILREVTISPEREEDDGLTEDLSSTPCYLPSKKDLGLVQGPTGAPISCLPHPDSGVSWWFGSLQIAEASVF